MGKIFTIVAHNNTIKPFFRESIDLFEKNEPLSAVSDTWNLVQANDSDVMYDQKELVIMEDR